MESHNHGAPQAVEPVRDSREQRALRGVASNGNDRPRTALLLGLMGEGKSSVGNLLLNTQVFPIAAGQAGGTKLCHIETAPAFDGRELRLVDLPGVNETRPAVQLPTVSPQGLAGPPQGPPETTFWSSLSEAFRCLGSVPGDGIDAFLLVMRCGNRVTEESYLFWETLLTDNFGPKVWSRVILVLTFVDQLETPPLPLRTASPRVSSEDIDEDENETSKEPEEQPRAEEQPSASEPKRTLRYGDRDSIRAIQQEILRGAQENPSFGKLLRRAKSRCIGVDASLRSTKSDDRSYLSASLLNQIRAVRALHNSEPYSLKDFQKAQEQLWLQRGQTQLLQSIPTARVSPKTQHQNRTSLARLHAESQTRRESYERAMKQLAQLAERENQLLQSLHQQVTTEIDAGRLPPPSRPPPHPPLHASRVMLLPSYTAPPGTLPIVDEQEPFPLQQAFSYPDMPIHRPIPVRPAGVKSQTTYTWAEAGSLNTTLPPRAMSKPLPTPAEAASAPAADRSPHRSRAQEKKQGKKNEKKIKGKRSKDRKQSQSETLSPPASPPSQQNGSKKNGMAESPPKSRTKRTPILSRFIAHLKD